MKEGRRTAGRILAIAGLIGVVLLVWEARRSMAQHKSEQLGITSKLDYIDDRTKHIDEKMDQQPGEPLLRALLDNLRAQPATNKDRKESGIAKEMDQFSEDLFRLALAREQEELKLAPLDPSARLNRTNEPWVKYLDVTGQTRGIFHYQYQSRCASIVQKLSKQGDDTTDLEKLCYSYPTHANDLKLISIKFALKAARLNSSK